MMKHLSKIAIVILLLCLLAGCGQQPSNENDSAENSAGNSSENTAASYRQISQEEAKEMMAKDDGHIILDVRRQDEFDAGHIPGAILIPNEVIGTERPEQLPDLDQIILVYCRSGNRSKQASQKLADMGYTNIYEFGGINTWTGEIVKEEEKTK